MSELRAVAVTQEQKGLSIQNFDDLQRIADYIAKSKLIPVHLQGKPADVAIILWKSHELGFSPMQGLDSIDVIQGKPAVKPEAQLALIYSKAPKAYVHVQSDSKTLVVTVKASREKGEEPQSFTWDMDRARKMQLDKKDNYVKQPLVMLKWRAIGEMARTVFPDIMRGLKNTEEALDWDNSDPDPTDKAAELEARLNNAKPIEVTVEPAQTSAPAQTAPAPEPTTTAEPESPASGPSAGDFIPAFDRYSGKALKSINPTDLASYYTKVKKWFHDEKQTPTGRWVELLARIEEHLFDVANTPEAKMPDTGPAEPDFGEFQP